MGPLLVPLLLVMPLGGALLARRLPQRAVLVGVALACLAVAALAVAATGRGEVLAWGVGAAPWRLGFALDRLDAWLLLGLAALHLLATLASPGGAQEPVVARGGPAFLLLAAIACLATNLACQLGAFELAAFGACARVGAWPAPLGARDVRAANAVLALVLGAALACIANGGGTLEVPALVLRAPAAIGADAQSLTLGAYLLFGGLAAAFVLLPPALAIPAGPPALGLAGLSLGALAATLIMRLFTHVFPCFTAGACGAAALALPFGLATLSGAALATLLARSTRELVGCLLLVLLSTQLIAVGSFRAGGFAAALFFAAHALLSGAALVLAVAAAPARGGRALLALALLAACGAPPAAGFVALVAVLRAAGPDALAVWSLLGAALLLAAAAGRRLVAGVAGPATAPRLPAVLALAAVLALGVLARPGFEFASAAARQLLDRGAYARGPAGGLGSGAVARHTRVAAPAAGGEREAR